jgi:hypothetical protein
VQVELVQLLELLEALMEVIAFFLPLLAQLGVEVDLTTMDLTALLFLPAQPVDLEEVELTLVQLQVGLVLLIKVFLVDQAKLPLLTKEVEVVEHQL